MAADEMGEAGQLSRRFGRRDQNSLRRKIRGEDLSEAIGHCEGGFAEGDDDDFAKIAKIEYCIAHTDAGAAPIERAGESGGDVDGRQRLAKNPLGELLHTFSSAAAPARATSRS